MKERKWEDLEMDCLVNVLGRVGMESLLLDIPFVCKSWHKASISPLCWKSLIFPRLAISRWRSNSLKTRFMGVCGINRLSETAFIKFIIFRSCRNASVLVLPDDCTEEALKYATDECPMLRILDLPSSISSNKQSSIIQLIGKLKNLECLSLASSINFREFLSQISLNCENFNQLLCSGGYIEKEEASAIVTLLPKIKHLSLRRASIKRENLVIILQGCKELEYLDASDSKGFKVDDKILELASHIPTFKHSGSRSFIHDNDSSSPLPRFCKGNPLTRFHQLN